MKDNREKKNIEEAQKAIKSDLDIADLEGDVLVNQEKLNVLTNAKYQQNVVKNKQVSSKKSKILLGVFGGITVASLAAGTAMLVVGINKSKQSQEEDPTVAHEIKFDYKQEGWELYCYDLSGDPVIKAKKGEKVRFLTYQPDSVCTNELQIAPTAIMINDIEFALQKLDAWTYGAEIEIPFAKNMECKLKFEEVIPYNLVILDAGEDAYFGASQSRYLEIPVGVGHKLTDTASYQEPIYKDVEKCFDYWIDELTGKPVDLSKEVLTTMYLTPVSQSSFAPINEEFKSAIAIKALTDLTIYLDSATAGKITFYNASEAEWENISVSASTPTTISKGTNLYLRGDNPSGFNTSTIEKDSIKLRITGDFTLNGSIMGLVDNGANTATEIPENSNFAYLFSGNRGLKRISPTFLPATKITEKCYRNLFNGCTTLSNCPILPATELSDHCYSEMFYYCPNLTKIPENLFANATTLANDCCVRMFAFSGINEIPEKLLSKFTTLDTGCYRSMFEHCNSLTSIPEKLLPAEEMKYQCYCDMFLGCENLTSVPENLLPATTLAKNCYEHMFAKCSKLENAPALPATDLTGCDFCYNYMFQDCESLKTCPELSSKKLSSHCYDCMFIGCSSITKMPELPATVLAEGCYQFMFSACSKLTDVVELPAETLIKDCYQGMFQDCISLETVPALKATTAAYACCMNMFMGCKSLKTIPVDYLKNILTLADHCYHNMFLDCTELTNTCLLPATELANWCYGVMFGDCYKINSCDGFELPALDAKERCYANMFSACSTMTIAPKIMLTSLAECCCIEMFSKCESLKINNEGLGTVFFTCPDTSNFPTAIKDMFIYTGGTFTAGTPIKGETYCFE